MKKTILMIVIAVVIAGVSGGGVYLWQQSAIKKAIQETRWELQQQITKLQDQVGESQEVKEPVKPEGQAQAKCLEAGQKGSYNCCDGLIKFENKSPTTDTSENYCIKKDSTPRGSCVGAGEKWIFGANAKDNPYVCCDGLTPITDTQSYGYCVYK